MSVAQVIRFDERQAIGRPRRKHAPAPCVILQLHRPPTRRVAATVTTMVMSDEDRIAGRGRDPG
jgi:hypothetical protein